VNPLRILAAIYAVLFAIVTSLASVIRAMENTGATVEHVYDY